MKAFTRLMLTISAMVTVSQVNAANFRTVVIDAGHGGHDHGGQWGKVYEKHLALDTAARLENKLKKMGYHTVMTRRSDQFISLPQRVSITNRHRNAIFISIHYNYTWKKDVCGMETFYYNPNSQRLAEYVQQSMLRKTNSVDRHAKFARYYVIKNTKVPSILIEGGFVSNKWDRNHMKKGNFRDAIANGVADGIQKYRRAG